MLSDELVREIAESAWFYRTDSPYLIVDTDLRIRAVNEAYEHVTDHSRSMLVGERLFDVFPDNPQDPTAAGVSRLSASLESVFRSARRHWMGVQRYDIPDPWQPSRFRPRVWTPVNSPIRHNGVTVGAVHHVEDVTSVVTAGHGGVPWTEIEAAVRTLAPQFPDLPREAVVATLVDSHRVIMAGVGRADSERAAELAALRLELLAGHPRLGPPVTSHLRPRTT